MFRPPLSLPSAPHPPHPPKPLSSQSPSLCLSISLSLSRSLFLFRFLSPCLLPVHASLQQQGYPYSNLSTGRPSLSLSISLSLSVCLSVSLSLSLSFSVSFSVSFSDSGSVSVSLPLYLSLSRSLCLSPSLSLSLSLSLSHCIAASRPPELPQCPGTVLHHPELSAYYWLSPSFPLHVLFTFPMMSLSCPFQSFQRPLHVPVIFSVCPLHFPCMSVLSLPVISLHLPSCRLVSLSFVSLSFPLHSPCFHFCPLHIPFSSPCFPANPPAGSLLVWVSCLLLPKIWKNYAGKCWGARGKCKEVQGNEGRK